MSRLILLVSTVLPILRHVIESRLLSLSTLSVANSRTFNSVDTSFLFYFTSDTVGQLVESRLLSLSTLFAFFS